jgi:hypothetical protein
MSMPVRNLTLKVLDLRMAVARLAPEDTVPDWAGGLPLSITRTAQELSIVCPEQHLPDDVTAERGWICLEIAGPIAFEEIGILAALTGELARAKISVFVFSTYDTDYFMVKADHLSSATKILTDVGHRVIT